MKYIYSTSQMSKLSLTLCTFSVNGSVASLFLTALVLATHNKQVVMPKSIVPDLEWFNGDRIKFEN